MFIVIMLQLLKNKSSPYLNSLVKFFKPEPNFKVRTKPHQTVWTQREPIFFQTNKIYTPLSGHKILSAGFSHAALVRGKQLYMWGNNVQGCLGCGPSMAKFMTPRVLDLFAILGIQVHSVASGKNHTLALTSNGVKIVLKWSNSLYNCVFWQVYSWGSSQFGQLGVGITSHLSHPKLVETLSEENIVQVSAGQYHSLAISKSGRAYSWGWGVHGQLGHANTDDQLIPTLITALIDKVRRSKIQIMALNNLSVQEKHRINPSNHPIGIRLEKLFRILLVLYC